MLKHFFKSTLLSRSNFHKTSLAFIILALFINIGCGKRQAPLPPLERVVQRTELNAFQRGNQVLLSWKMPSRNASEISVQNVNRVDIYRLAQPVNSVLTLSEEEFASQSNLIASVPVSPDDFALKTMSYADRLDLAGQPVRLRYALRFVNSANQKAAFSNFVILEPAAKIAASPNLSPAQITQDEIKLVWSAPEINIDGSKPVNLLGYNVYRSNSRSEAAKMVNRNPLSETFFSDSFFSFGNEYFYFVRAVSLGSEGEPVESLESNIVRVLPQDNFPPSTPKAITIAAAPNNISIFFAVNPEKDIAGYKVYRSDDPNLPKSQWILLTPELLTVNTFQDANILSGKTYFYFLQAVDKVGNISQPSEIVSETAP